MFGDPDLRTSLRIFGGGWDNLGYIHLQTPRAVLVLQTIYAVLAALHLSPGLMAARRAFFWLCRDRLLLVLASICNDTVRHPTHGVG